MDFSGFPDGRLSMTPLPDLFFSELLPQIDELGELKLTLYILWRLAHHKAPLCVSRSELQGDKVLQRALGVQALDDALRRAVQRRTLIAVDVRNKKGEFERWFFANNAEGRRDAERIKRGQPLPQTGAAPVAAADAGPRPNIFVLYERHIGMLTQLVAEQLQDANQTYPAEWLPEAFEIAAHADKRSWRYVQAILQRWASEGKARGLAPAKRKPSPAPRLKPKR
jgi:DNA replication protein